MSGRNIIKADALNLAARKAAPGGAAGNDASPPARRGPVPDIVLHRNGDTIDAIEVTCACGQTMIIECEYEEEPTS